MIELPVISLDIVRETIQNFPIIATLVLLYNFIPDFIISRSKLIYSLCVGGIFGLHEGIAVNGSPHVLLVPKPLLP